MKKFKVEVNVCSEYKIEIDDEALGDDFIQHFHRYFSELETWEDHAINIATQKALGSDFIEGYGIPMLNGKNPMPFAKEGLENKAINIIPVFELDIDTDCSEY